LIVDFPLSSPADGIKNPPRFLKGDYINIQTF